MRPLTLKDLKGIRKPDTANMFDWFLTCFLRASELLRLRPHHDENNNRNHLALPDKTPAPAIKKRKTSHPQGLIAQEENKEDIDTNDLKPRQQCMINLSEKISPPIVVPETIIPSSATHDKFLNHITQLSGGVITSWKQMERVIQKRLTETDLTAKANRLLIPIKQIKCGKWLNQEEEDYLQLFLEKKENVPIEANILEPNLQQNKINLSKWKMSENQYYTLNKPWKEIVDNNGLEIGMNVELWAFRVQEKLWFALIKLPKSTT